MRVRRFWLGVSAMLLLAGGAFLGRAYADAKGPKASDADVAQIVTDILERGHILQSRVDDTISERLFLAVLRSFDPLKLYFLQKDVDEFSRWKDQLDDRTRAGDVQFVFEVYQRFLERLDARAAWAKEFADAPIDLEKKETMVIDPDAATYAVDDAEAKERWRVRVKFELTSLIVDGKTEKEARERIHRRYRNLSNNWHKMNGDELVELYLASLTSSFDPHSTYMSSNTVEDFNIAINLSLEGIGAILQSEDGQTIVKEVVAGGAADADGRLKPGDKIVGVAEGDDGEVLDIVDMKLRDVVRHIRGKAGTIVRLEVVPANAQKAVTYALTRRKIELKDGEAKGEIVELPPIAAGLPAKVGVIRLPSFYADNDALRLGDAGAKTATNDVRRILEDFNRQGVAAVVVDLRNNGGGLLNEAIELTGLFIDDGPVVQARDSAGQVQRHNDPNPGVVYRGPLVVIVNRFSASASEIFAGAIQDYGRGIVVGDSATHGKGSVQKVVDLSRFRRLADGTSPGAVKLTMQKFYRVNGQSTQNRGVKSDIVLPSPSDHDDFGEAKLDFALDFDRIEEAPHGSMDMIHPALVEQLRLRSQQRMATDPELRKLAEKKARAHERRARKSITFNLASLKAEHDEVGKDKDEEDPEDDLVPGAKKKEKKFGEDPYSREVLGIVDDYLKLKDASLTAGRAPKG